MCIFGFLNISHSKQVVAGNLGVLRDQPYPFPFIHLIRMGAILRISNKKTNFANLLNEILLYKLLGKQTDISMELKPDVSKMSAAFFFRDDVNSSFS